MKKNVYNPSPNFDLIVNVVEKIFSFILFILSPVLIILNLIYTAFKSFINGQTRSNITNYIGILLFLIISIHIANLQIFGFQGLRKNANSGLKTFTNITLAKRGQIFIQDYNRNQEKIPLTSTEILSSLVIDPLELQNIYRFGKEPSDIARALATNLNISYNSTLTLLEANKDKNTRYLVLEKFITDSQAQTAKLLIEKNPDKLNYNAWLDIQETMQRSYPLGDFLGSTIGYVPFYKVTKEEALSSDCREMIEKNERNNAGLNEYSIGYYGLEQKYCSLLGGLNGKKYYNGLNLLDLDTVNVQDGANLVLTLDLTLQRKTDELLLKYIEQNTNENGKPENASIIVMESKTGRILALSSYPSFDPNNYTAYPVESYRNVATSLDYEVGSTMKPLTVAAALSEYDKGTLNSEGKRLGVSSNFFKRDYGSDGKRYQEISGTLTPSIRNSQGISYASDPTCCDLKRTVRDSLNTMISDIVDSVGTVKLTEYFKDKFLFNKTTEGAFAGGGSGNLSTLETQLDCLFCFSQHGFGQGLYLSPLQLMRAFTTLANDGLLVEPRLIDKIEYSDGKIDTGENPSSPIAKTAPYPVLSQQSARLVTEYMKSVIDEGYLGRGNFKNSIPGYSVSAKTGTAQITRPNKDGTPCAYACNTEKGFFDHSLIGYAPSSNPEIMVMVKIAKPKPGEKTNFADGTSMPVFRETMQFALEYKKIPKDR
jgi:penicillin-binding protein 2X